jgi:hypothetical protein
MRSLFKERAHSGVLDVNLSDIGGLNSELYE